METKRFRLASMPGAQAHVAILMDSDNILAITLVSYATEVITIDFESDEPYYICTGTYSKTTAKHINRFTQEFLGSNQYYICREIAITGEARILSEEEMACVKRQTMRYLYNDLSRRYYGNY